MILVDTMFGIRARIREEMKTVVSPSETITLIIRQSLWHSISPSALVVTDRRVVIIHHSFWGLYTKINLISPTEINIVEHKNVMSVAIGMGIIFGTVRLRIHGFVEPTRVVKYEWDLYGMWQKDALEITNVIGRVIEERSAAQDAKISQTNAKEGENETENTMRSDAKLKGDYEAPVAIAIKNEKIIATEKIMVPKQTSKIYGRLFGSLFIIVGISGILSALGYNFITLLPARLFLNVTNSILLIIIGALLIKLA
jgi:hypothetical protein